MPPLNETSDRLIVALQELMDEYGPAGVVHTAQQMITAMKTTPTEREQA